jgi:hypothetical protein
MPNLIENCGTKSFDEFLELRGFSKRKRWVKEFGTFRTDDEQPEDWNLLTRLIQGRSPDGSGAAYRLLLSSLSFFEETSVTRISPPPCCGAAHPRAD